MSKITVSETVSRSIAVDNSKADVQNAMIRCFQLLEERRFKEANVIIEQVLNIDPNNTDANVANFLVHYKLTSAEDIVNNFKSCVTYKNSLFYERVKRCTQNESSRKLHVCLRHASELLEQKSRDNLIFWRILVGIFILWSIFMVIAEVIVNILK